MKIKHMTRNNWREVLKKNYKIQDSYFAPGKTSLIEILEVSESVSFTYENGEPFVMCDVGYDWLQIAYKNQPYWITGFFSPEGKLIQIYIDMIGKTDYSDENDPSMNDLYVDVVIEFGKYHILDLDEFEEAYQNEDITKEEYDTTLINYQSLCHYLDKHMNEFVNQVIREYEIIKKA